MKHVSRKRREKDAMTVPARGGLRASLTQKPRRGLAYRRRVTLCGAETREKNPKKIYKYIDLHMPVTVRGPAAQTLSIRSPMRLYDSALRAFFYDSR